MTVKALMMAVVLLQYCGMVIGAEWPDCGGAGTDLRPCWSKCLGGVHKKRCASGRSTGTVGDQSSRACCGTTSVLGCKKTQKLCVLADWDKFYETGDEYGGTAGCSNNACDGTTRVHEVGKFCATEGNPLGPPACPEEFASTEHANIFCPFSNVSPSGYEYKNICKATRKFTRSGGLDSGKYKAAAHRSRFGDIYELEEEDQQGMDARFDEFEQELENELDIDRLKLRLDRARLTQNQLRRQRRHQKQKGA